MKGKLPLPPSSMEEIALKNITEPVAVYKYTPEAILGMPDAGGSTPLPMIMPEEERTTPPFAVNPPATSGDGAGP